MITIIFFIPFFKNEKTTLMCFTHYKKIAKELSNDRYTFKLVLFGSEGDKSKQIASKFTDLYFEIKQPHTILLSDSPKDIKKKYIENLLHKYKHSYLSLKNIDFDYMFMSGSDDFIDIKYYQEAINIINNNNNNNEPVFFRNTIYDSSKKRGGMFCINYEKNFGFLISNFIYKKPRPYSSQIMGSYGFSKSALLQVGLHNLTANEGVIERLMYENKIKTFDIPSIYYNIKSNINFNCCVYDDYKVNKYPKRPMNKEEIYNYIQWKDSIIDKIPNEFKQKYNYST